MRNSSIGKWKGKEFDYVDGNYKMVNIAMITQRAMGGESKVHY